MGTLRLVTLTGAGHGTSFARMARVAKMHPFVEWGVLFSQAQAGMENRYPTLEWLEKFAKKANSKGMRIALHLCGLVVRNLISEAETGQFSEQSKRVLALAERFGRVQLNTRAKMTDVHNLIKLIERIHRCENRTSVILQWNDHNKEVCLRLGREQGFECLVDESGGRGVVRDSWPDVSRFDVPRIGYAGGLGPENVRAHLKLITTAANDRSFWIDAEGKLRNAKDQLDLDICEQHLSEVHEFWLADRQKEGAKYGKGRRQVASLSGLWLDWWLSLTQFDVTSTVLPPADVCAAVTLHKQSGKFELYRPSENAHQATRLFAREQVALIPNTDGTWKAFSLENPELTMTGDSLELAGLRAVVAKHFGKSVPKNPTQLLAALKPSC